MFYGWHEDAQTLVDLIPVEAPVRTRAEYLLADVASRGGHLELSVLLNHGNLLYDGPFFNPTTDFIVTEVTETHGVDPNSNLGRLLGNLVTGETVEAVLMNPVVPTMLLPRRQAEQRLGNGIALLHGLQHITEIEDNFPGPSVTDAMERTGKSERRAYDSINIALFKACDGPAYDEYVSIVPSEITVTPKGNNIYNFQYVFDGLDSTPPPMGTLMRSVWDEGGKSRGGLGATVLCSLAVAKTTGIPRDKADKFLGHLLGHQ